MKPIIIDMKDMSDSTEVYDSKPNRFMIYTIYAILSFLKKRYIVVRNAASSKIGAQIAKVIN